MEENKKSFIGNLNTIQKICILIFVVSPFARPAIDKLVYGNEAEQAVFISLMIGSFLGFFLFKPKEKE